MAIDTTQLDKIIQFVQKLKELPGSEQFIARLRDVVNDEQLIVTQDPKIDEIYEYCVEKISRQQAEQFYESFPIHEIKTGLIEDFVRMEMFRRRDNFKDFCLAVYQQIERITNHICEWPSINKVAEKMWAYPAYVKTGKDVVPSIYNRVEESKFLIADLVFGKSNAYEKSKQTVQSLNAMAKVKTLVYFVGYKAMITNTDYNSFVELTSSLGDIYWCRNMNHRGGSPTEYDLKNQTKILPLQCQYYLIFMGALAKYVSYIAEGIASIPEIEKYADSVEKKTVPAPTLKILGKIDLPPDNKNRFK